MENAAKTYDERELIEEAIANFTALIDDADYDGVIDMMGIGKLQFLRRKQMRLELGALRMALWRLALSRSFPCHADEMFAEFLKRYSAEHPDRRSLSTVNRAREYWGMLEPGGDSDFHAVARHLISFMATEADSNSALTLKLALFIRHDYRFIFDRLI